ncbi:Uma2 family endonuclease [Actinopolyspora sp. H202]|uniref:Uma2 family endonuclease n=1 Tax=Actinopolyspora sp. H202 TaxID=1500456 RepID=UPI003EE6C98C
MTAMSWPDHLLSLEEFERLPEDDSRRYELQEGVLHVTPKAAGIHQRAVKRLASVLDRQLPLEWEAIPDVEVVIVSSWPPVVRVPDVVVATAARIDQNPNRLYAQDLLLAVEVVSPGSSQTDRVVKRHEYAKAGIPGYWVLDLDEPVTIAENRLHDGGYKSHSTEGGVFRTGEPFEFEVELESLVRRGGAGIG